MNTTPKTIPSSRDNPHRILCFWGQGGEEIATFGVRLLAGGGVKKNFFSAIKLNHTVQTSLPTTINYYLDNPHRVLPFPVQRGTAIATFGVRLLAGRGVNTNCSL